MSLLGFEQDTKRKGPISEIIRRLFNLERIVSRIIPESGTSGDFRELLTADRTYYVRTDGSDSNNGLTNTAGGAFLTVQHAIDVVAALDISIYDVTIQIASGTYSTSVNLLKAPVGAGSCIIIGDETTPSNVLISSSGQFCFQGDSKSGNNWQLRGMKLSGASIGAMFIQLCAISFQNLDFGTNTLYHIFAGSGAAVSATGNYTISGSVANHWGAFDGGLIAVQARTVTLTGTPAFSSAFATSSRVATIACNANTFSGSATGKRYQALSGGVIDTLASGTETYLPGDTLGTVASGGKYVSTLNNLEPDVVKTQFDKTNTTFASITGLSKTLLAGRYYSGRLVLYTTSNVAGGVKVDFNGGTATATTFIAEANIFQGGALVAPGASRSAALGTTIANVTAVTVATIVIDFTILVNAAGTFIPRFACNVATGTSSVLVGSPFTIEDVTG